MLDFSNSFDTSASLAALYLWLMFSYLSVLLNCDLQRMIAQHAALRHLLGIVAFYFLFTVIDPQNNVPVWVTLAKTLMVYSLFVLGTKSRWYYAGSALTLLLVDQMIKNHMAYLQKTDPQRFEQESAQKYKRVRQWLLVMIIVIIFIGTVDYYMKQQRDKGDRFRWTTFFLGTNQCRGY